MTDIQRHQYGVQSEVEIPVDSAIVIEDGDICWYNTDDVRNAAALADQGSEAQNKAALSAAFCGVAAQASASGETKQIKIIRSGIFEFPLDTALVAVQAVFTAVECGADADGCDDQIVEVGSTSPIGRLVKQGEIGDTTVLVEIYNVYTPYVTAS